MNEPVGDSGLGRVDLLFNFLRHLNKEAPADLNSYLASLHDNVEMRPLAEQVIDALLAEDPSRYENFNLVQVDADAISLDPRSQSARMHQQIGHFLTSWVDLEESLRNLAPREDDERIALPIFRLLDRLTMLDAETRHEINLLRRVRNSVVHGRDVPPISYLAEATDRVQEITERVRRILP
ncbi:hypothetical protein [Streptomyces blattellae]|uniref:hypothetical protein n=1 Tax=Streptomyces blattellae TaxID=2569855 RepID=UPI001E29E607|nr:hypothetical protein [Streptomyces blattellae]